MNSTFRKTIGRQPSYLLVNTANVVALALNVTPRP